ncbi:LysR substrate-binding domain-containing protein [Lentilactobacillus senioris]|uniref:LysR substrate-binding domain-containing protein n=1 Tax=Lentilactobacillus senioris TaxID=931534 RepID=UPI002092E9D7|nr:LysR substrate-binding domain-containing protein [Lentilactobacillus senioris]
MFTNTSSNDCSPPVFKKRPTKNPSYDWNITVDNSESILGLIDNKRLDVGLIEKSMLTDTDLVVRRELATDQLVRIGEPTGTWLIREPGSGIEHYTELFFNEYDIKPEHTIMLNRNDLIMELVASGVGETIISKSVLPSDYPYTELNPHFKRSLYFLNSKHMNREILELVYDSVKQIAQEIYPMD